MPATAAGPGGSHFKLESVLDFLRMLWQLDHALQTRSSWMLKHLGVTGPQRLVLRLVGASPGIAASDIAATMMLHRSTMTGILKRLERRQLLERFADPSDGRRALFRLSAAGERLNQTRSGTVELAVRRVLAKASARQIDATLRTLELMSAELAGLEQAPSDSGSSKRRR